MQQRQVGILIFDDVEVLDFAGPFEVFSVAGQTDGIDPFNVFTVAPGKQKPVLARNGLSINADFMVGDCPPVDILVVPGGYGTRPLLNDSELLDWIRARSSQAELTLSVCTGALLLAKAGLLQGLGATTHHAAVDELRELAQGSDIYPDHRIVDNGNMILAAGISSGIDMALYVVARLLDQGVAERTAAYMEYRLPEDLDEMAVKTIRG